LNDSTCDLSADGTPTTTSAEDNGSWLPDSVECTVYKKVMQPYSELNDTKNLLIA